MFLQGVTSFLRRLFIKPAPQSFLRLLADSGLGSVHTLGEKPTVLGRHRGQQQHRFDYLVIDSETVGRQHAVIEYRDGFWWVFDQSSLNGTFVNDRRVESQALRHGDRIRLHKIEFEFLLSAPTHTGSNVDLTIPAAGMGGGDDVIDNIQDIDIDQVIDITSGDLVAGQGGSAPEPASDPEDVTEQVPQAGQPVPGAQTARPEDQAAESDRPAETPDPAQGSDEETTFLSQDGDDDTPNTHS